MMVTVQDNLTGIVPVMKTTMMMVMVSTTFVVYGVSAFIVPPENPRSLNNSNNNNNYCYTRQQRSRSSHRWMMPFPVPSPEIQVQTSKIVSEPSSLSDVSSMTTSTLHSSTMDWLSASSSSNSFLISEAAVQQGHHRRLQRLNCYVKPSRRSTARNVMHHKHWSCSIKFCRRGNVNRQMNWPACTGSVGMSTWRI